MGKKISRRTVLGTAVKGAAAGAGLAAIGMSGTGCAGPKPAPRPSLDFKNEDFYDAAGEFIEDRGKDAYVTLMKYHGYSLADKAKANLWVSDYGTKQFLKLGLGAWMFKNNVDDRYMLMDLYLLPNQMLPEHWHLEGEGNPAKLEGWLIRHGLSHVVGEGEPNVSAEVVVPKCHDGGKVTTKHSTIAKPGVFVQLVRVESKHWQLAGPEGAIITEVANVHTNSAVRHQDKAINDHFLNG